jgi:transcriptional regulator with XRE-family HTH domain
MNRNGLIKHVDLWAYKLGSYSKVANKCNINVGALSTILNGKYGANESAMLQKIAKALDYKESNWKIVPTTNGYKLLQSLIKDAKSESMWFIVSNPAGSGKSACLEDLFNKDTSGSLVYMLSEEWSGRQFLTNLILKTLGEKVLEGKYKTIVQLTDLLVNYFNDMSLDKPVLIIDESDKLKPGALRTLIPIYNRTEERLGLVVSGTESLEKEIKAGVRIHKKGYDEIESRFGRSYIHLRGTSQKEVYDICLANGVSDTQKQEQIWNNLEKQSKPTYVKTPNGNKEVMVTYAQDLRVLKRLIQKENLKSKQAA